jgi:hypothetical protein
MSKLYATAALVLTAACAAEPPSAPDAGAPPAEVDAPGPKALDRLEDRMTPPALVDETVIVPHGGDYPILDLASDADHHYALAEDRVHVLAADGTPVDRHGIALDLPDTFFFEYKYALGAADGHLGVVYQHRNGAIRLRVYRRVGSGLGPDPVDVAVQGDPGSGRLEPTLVHGGSAWWVVYNSPQGRADMRHDAVTYRRFALDGTALDAAPVVVANAATDTRVAATFAGGHLVTAWRDGDAVAMARVAADGRLLDPTPVRLAGGSADLALAGNDHELVLRRGGTVHRLDHDLVARGAPISFARTFLSAHLAPTSRGFRLLWTDRASHLLDLPTGAEPGAAIALDGVREASAIAMGPDDATVVVQPGTWSGTPPEVTRLAAGGAVAARELLYEVLRGEYLIDMVGTDDHRAALWTRDPGERVAAALTATGALLAPPEEQPRDSTLVARTGGYWRVAATSVQPLDAALAPAGAPIEHGVRFAQLAPLADTVLLVWDQDGAVRGQRVATTGVVDAAPFVIAAGASDAFVRSGADEWLVLWAERATIKAVRVGADGTLRDAAPRELATGSSSSSITKLTAVPVGGGDYTVVWTHGSALRASRLSAARGFAPAIDFAGYAAGNAVTVVADGTSTLILTSTDGSLPTGALHRIDAAGGRVARSLPHQLPTTGLVRTATGHFLVVGDVPWVIDGAGGRRLVARVLTLDGNGVACTSGDECVSGVCADGVCCDRACGSGDGDCAACSVAAGAARDGVCAPRQAGAECRAATAACDAAETCDGASSACPADGPAADDTACDDGDRCTTGDACRGGACGGAAVECPAPGECQTAACDEDQGCLTAPVRDGVSCSVGQCHAGACTPLPVDAGVPDAGLPDAQRPDAPLPDATPVPVPAPTDDAAGDDGCGCRGAPSSAPIWLGLLGAFALVRRRRVRGA